MPLTTRAIGTNGSSSCVVRLSARLINTCVVRPFGSLNANATVPRVFSNTRGSSGMFCARHACAITGSPAIPTVPTYAHAYGIQPHHHSSHGAQDCKNGQPRTVPMHALTPTGCRLL